MRKEKTGYFSHKNHFLSIPALFLIPWVFAACSGFELKGRSARPLEPFANPLPLKAGISVDEQRTTDPAAPTVDYGAPLAEILKQSAVFQTIHYPMALDPSNLRACDLVIYAQFWGDYRRDPVWLLKAAVSGFLLLLPAPLIRYHDTYSAEGLLVVKDKDGRQLKRYRAKEEVSVSSRILSTDSPQTHEQAARLAARNLAEALARTLAEDRALFENFSSSEAVKNNDLLH